MGGDCNGNEMMKTIPYLFGLEVRRPVLWLLSLVATIGVLGISHPGAWGVVAILLVAVALTLFPVALMKRSPWCSDLAFWRTRPISRAELFAVKSLVLVVVGLAPMMLVVGIASARLDEVTRVTLRLLALGFGGGLAFSLAAVAAITTAGKKFQAMGWQAVFTVPILSAMVLGFFRTRLEIMNPYGQAGFVSGLLVGGGVILFVALLAWLIVGWKGRFRPSLMVLIAGGLIWPWVVGTCRLAFLAKDEPEYQMFRIEEGRSLLNGPVRVAELDEDEFFLPSSVYWSGGYVYWSGRNSNSKMVVGNEEQLSPLSDDHPEFSSVMDTDALWERLRAQLPEHESWMPTEQGKAGRHVEIRIPEEGLLGLEAKLEGNIYQFHGFDPIGTSESGPHELRRNLKFLSSGAPNGHALDIKLRMTVPVLSDTRSRWMARIAPPEIWGILYHEPSRTAYGTVSTRTGRFPDGISGAVIWRQDLLLRFELPRLESALLGLDPRKVLEESELYLFEASRVGPAIARRKF